MRNGRGFPFSCQTRYPLLCQTGYYLANETALPADEGRERARVWLLALPWRGQPQAAIGGTELLLHHRRRLSTLRGIIYQESPSPPGHAGRGPGCGSEAGGGAPQTPVGCHSAPYQKYKPCRPCVYRRGMLGWSPLYATPPIALCFSARGNRCTLSVSRDGHGSCSR
jgi:hypothetical protein